MTITVDLDFDSIKANIIEYLRGQDEFADYDFEGSAMTVLIDALAHATHYNGMIANMSHSESFLDSASLRRNVLSRAKELNYFPRQTQSSWVSIKLSIDVKPIIADPLDYPTRITVNKGKKFVSSKDSSTFTFVTTTDEFLYDTNSNGVYEAEFYIYEGTYFEQNWIYDAANPQRFHIPHEKVDTSYMTVAVKTNIGSPSAATWALERNIIDVDSSSEVYFIQESEEELVEIYFGDGVLGKNLINENVVICEYLASLGPDSNGCSTFELIDSIETYSPTDFVLTSTDKAAGGSSKESIDSIKHLAPKMYQAQNRAVTVEDYKALLLNKYGFIEALNVWGGEDNDPPQYGVVFVSIKPNYGTELSPATKQKIQDEVLDKFGIVSIVPIIVDPEILYIDTFTEVYYDRTITILSNGELENAVKININNFFDGVVSLFDAQIRYSKFLPIIDNTDNSIISNETHFTVTKKFKASTNDTQTREFLYTLPLTVGSLYSNKWVGNYGDEWQLIEDDTDLNIYIYKNGEKQGSSVGNIYHDSGKVILKLFNPDLVENQIIALSALPVDKDIVVGGNNLLVQGDVTITTKIKGFENLDIVI